MIKAIKKHVARHIFSSPVKEMEAVAAYNLWSATYDSQPGNLMLDLDKLLFLKLLDSCSIRNKVVADIGCGTGRHWPDILKRQPANLSGFDVSPGMLGKLQEKYPDARVYTLTGDCFPAVGDYTFDVIISTLTVAHIENIEATLQAWCSVLKYEADIIITDFHPEALAFGGKRTFRFKKRQIAVRNFVYPVNRIAEILFKNGFRLVADEERQIDETVKHYYEDQNALHVYEKFKGCPVIYGAHFRRCDDTE